MAHASVEARPRPGVASLPDAPGTTQAASARAMRIVVLVWSAAWLVLMSVFEGVDQSLVPALSWTMLAGLVVGWFVVVLAHLPVGAAYVGVLAGTALVQAAITQPVGLWSQSSVLVTWTNLATLSCGFLIAGTRGRLGVVAIAGTQLLLLTTRAMSDGTWDVAWRGIVAAAAYALADGMAAHVAAGAVRAQSRDADAAADRLALERSELAAREAQVRESERVARVLHDTVLNTLGALRRGVGPGESDAIRARCAHDLSELRHLRDQRFVVTGDTGVGGHALVQALASRGAVLSLDVDVRSRITTTTTIPTAVADAVAGACAEALINVAKHSGVRAAELSLDWDGVLLEVRVHDQGCGWSGELVAEHGLSRSILGRSTEAGIVALVATAPGDGTSVTLTWRAPSRRAAASEPDAAPARTSSAAAAARVMATVAVRAGGWVTALLAFLTVVFWGSTNPVTAAAALVILGAVLALSWHLGVRRGRMPIPWAYAVALVVAAFLVTGLPARTATTCNQLAEGWWGLDGAMVVLLPLVLLTRGWWWSAAGSVAMLLGALSLYLRVVPIPAECAQLPAVTASLELSIVVAMVIFREALLRLWGRASDARARAERLRIEAEVRKATERARDARVDAVLAATVPLLDTLAAGLADPSDDGVRRQCTAAESALRSLLTLGPTHDDLRDLLADAVLDAFAQGSALEVMPSFGEVALPGEAGEAGRAGDAVGPLRALLREVVDALPPEHAATAALIRGPEGSSLTLVSGTRFEPVSAETGRRLASAGLALDQAEVGTQSLVEVRWS